MAVVSVISVNIIAPVISCFEIGFSFSSWASALRSMPFVWLAVIACVLITYRPAEWVTARFLRRATPHNARILVNILSTVCMMSVILTIIAPWIVAGHVSLRTHRAFLPPLAPVILRSPSPLRHSLRSLSPAWS